MFFVCIFFPVDFMTVRAGTQDKMCLIFRDQTLLCRGEHMESQDLLNCHREPIRKRADSRWKHNKKTDMATAKHRRVLPMFTPSRCDFFPRFVSFYLHVFTCIYLGVQQPAASLPPPVPAVFDDSKVMFDLARFTVSRLWLSVGGICWCALCSVGHLTANHT